MKARDQKKYLLRKELLKECPHRARRFLINSIIKAYFKMQGKQNCFRCGEPVVGEFHLDHIKAWAEDPAEAIQRYYDLENLSLSHPECNSFAHNKYFRVACQIQRVIERRKRKQEGDRRYKENKKARQKESL